MGAHLRVLSRNFPMNTNMTGFRWISDLCVCVLCKKLALAMEGLTKRNLTKSIFIIEKSVSLDTNMKHA